MTKLFMETKQMNPEQELEDEIKQGRKNIQELEKKLKISGIEGHTCLPSVQINNLIATLQQYQNLQGEIVESFKRHKLERLQSGEYNPCDIGNKDYLSEQLVLGYDLRNKLISSYDQLLKCIETNESILRQRNLRQEKQNGELNSYRDWSPILDLKVQKYVERINFLGYGAKVLEGITEAVELSE